MELSERMSRLAEEVSARQEAYTKQQAAEWEARQQWQRPGAAITVAAEEVVPSSSGGRSSTSSSGASDPVTAGSGSGGSSSGCGGSSGGRFIGPALPAWEHAQRAREELQQREYEARRRRRYGLDPMAARQV
jgi:hypothetical protein